MSNEFSALDVSQYQGNIDWADLAAQVAAGTLGGVMIRATYGLDGVDPDFATNWRAAAQAGVPAGPYHYANPDQPANGQAAHFWTTVEAAGGWPHRHLRPALDLEQLGGLADAALQAWATDWLTAVEQASGVMPMLYGSEDFLEAHLAPILGHWPLWVADWGGTVGIPHVGHQFTDAGHIAGIGGNVDMDRFAASVLLTTPLVAPTIDWSGSDTTALRWHFTPPTSLDYQGWAEHPDSPGPAPTFHTDAGYWEIDWRPQATSLVLTFWFGGQTVSVTRPLRTPQQQAIADALVALDTLAGDLSAAGAALTAARIALTSASAS
jgi:GH25 family lysozyme M1 (1,4-beta-N-acetylmuramidase)